MLRKLKHAGKIASKYQFVATLNQLEVQGTKSWQPHKLVVVWSRRKKRKTGSAQSWRPSIENPYRGIVKWNKQESLEIKVTLFRSQHVQTFEPKDWVFVIENETYNGKRKPVATVRVDMSKYVTDIPTSHNMVLQLKPLTRKLASAKLDVTFRCTFLSEGLATDTDMMSLAGSTASEDTIRLGDIDVGNLHDLDDTDIENSRGSSLDGSLAASKDISMLTQQIEMLCSSMDKLDNTSSKRSSTTDQVIINERKSSTSGGRQSISSTTPDQTSTTGASRLSKEIDASRASVSSSGEGESKRNSRITQSDSSEATTPVQKRRLKSSDVISSTLTESPVLLNNTAQNQQKLLLKWCQSATEGYRGVKVTNFTTSWRNGLALCALLHHFEPNLIDFEDLQSLNAKGNIVKALHGFTSLDIPLLQEPNPTFISDKSFLISYLNKIKSHFYVEKEDPIDTHNLVGIPEIQLNDNDPSSQVAKSLRSYPFNLGEVRAKLLSDLVEKEDEDDVFSCALDDALPSDENETNQFLEETKEVVEDVEIQKKEFNFIKKEKEVVKNVKVEKNPFLSEDEEITDKNIKENNFTTLFTKPPVLKADILIENNVDNAIVSPKAEHSSFNDSGLEKSPELQTKKLPESTKNIEIKNNFIQELDPILITQPEPIQNVSLIENKIDNEDIQVALPSSNHRRTSDLEESLSEAREVNNFSQMNHSCHDKLLLNDNASRYSNKSFDEQFSTSIKLVKVTSVVSATSELPIDIVLRSLKETDFSEQFASDTQTVNHILPQKQNSPKLQKNKDTQNNYLFASDKSDQMISSEVQDISDFEIQVHVPSQVNSPSEISSLNPLKVNSSQDFTNSESVSIKSAISDDNFKTETEDQVIDTEEKTEKGKFEREEDEKVLDEDEKKDEQLDKTVEELLKSSAKRNKKAKTKELIEKAKAEAFSSKTLPSSNEETKRKQEVRERAQRLIEQTRATLGRTKKLSIQVSEDMPDVNNVIEQPSKLLLYPTSPVLTNSNESIKSENEDKTIQPNNIERDKITTENNHVKSNSSIESLSQNNEVISNLKVVENKVDEDHIQTAEKIENNLPEVNSDYSNPFLSENDQKNINITVEPVLVAPENQLISSETTTNINNSDLETNIVKNPTFKIDENVEKALKESNEKDETAKFSVVDDPLNAFASQPEEPAVNKQENPVIITSTPMENESFKYDSSTVVKRSSTPNPENEEVHDKIESVLSPIAVVEKRKKSAMNRLSGSAEKHKRWSAAFRNKSNSTSEEVANVLKELEKEKKALEKEQRQVEERSTDVQIELQQLKSTGSRYSKEKESEIMKEWFQLVHKKNSILRQQDQLALMEEEQDIIKQVEKIHKQLIPLMAIEDEMKSDLQKNKEQELLVEKFRLVNEQDRVMQEMNDKEQQALEEEERFQTSLGENLSKVTQQDEKCVVM